MAVFYLKNSDMSGISTVVNNQIFIYSDESMPLQGYDFYPVNPKPYAPLMSKTIYHADAGLKPDKSHFVLAYQWFKILCIVPLNKLSEPLYFKFNDTSFSKFDINDQKANYRMFKNLPLQYVVTYVTDNYIYALYAGKTGAELENHSHEASLSQGMFVHVFNWDGSAHCSLNLDRVISCFCIDEKNSVIYGTDPT
jgi:hypothetical protein